MLTKCKIAFLLLASAAMLSCENIKDSTDDCGVWLEFVFDHNMEYADAFEAQVKTVDVYLFDQSGVFVETRHAAVDQLDGRKRMFLGRELPEGVYRLLTVGNLSADFTFTDLGGGAFTPGVTTFDQARLALKHDGEVTERFDHLYFGQIMDIENRADLSVYRVPLKRQTNRFDILLHSDEYHGTRAVIEPAYTVEIVAPEYGAYNYQNDPLIIQNLSHRPYELTAASTVTETATVFETTARLNTMRLLASHRDDYRIVVRSIEEPDEILWSRSLIPLLAGLKAEADIDLPLQEYLDRESDWNIVIAFQGNALNPALPPTQGFVALSIMINGWIVWDHDMGV